MSRVYRELTNIPASDEWEGFFDVGDLPSPTFRTVHYTATDAGGTSPGRPYWCSSITCLW